MAMCCAAIVRIRLLSHKSLHNFSVIREILSVFPVLQKTHQGTELISRSQTAFPSFVFGREGKGSGYIKCGDFENKNYIGRSPEPFPSRPNAKEGKAVWLREISTY